MHNTSYIRKLQVISGGEVCMPCTPPLDLLPAKHGPLKLLAVQNWKTLGEKDQWG